MATLGTFHAQLSSILNRGTVYDALIPDYVRQAARHIERVRTFKQMDRFVSFTLDAAQTEPRAYPFPTEVKSFSFIRLLLEDDSLWYLDHVDPRDVTVRPVARPNRFWLDSVQFIWLDNVPDQNYSAEMNYRQYTTWPTDPASSNYLTDRYEDLLLAESAIRISPKVRMPGLAQIYREGLEELWQSVSSADDELWWEGRSSAMVFGRNYDEE